MAVDSDREASNSGTVKGLPGSCCYSGTAVVLLFYRNINSSTAISRDSLQRPQLHEPRVTDRFKYKCKKMESWEGHFLKN